MTTKNTTIKGINFTFKKEEPYFNGYSEITDLYARPSETKREIFREWEEKLDCIYGLTGNSNHFTIYGEIKDEEGKIHDVKITKWHNYILN